MQINRENLNKIRQAGQIQINRIRVELNDWLKLSRIFLGLTVKLGTVKSAVLLSTQLETDRVRMITLRRLGRLNTQAQIDQLCAVWYDTRNSMLGNLIAQKEWVASQPLAVKILSSLQAEQADKLDKTDLTVLAELIRLCQAETDLRLARLAADQLNGIQDEAVLKALLSHWTQHDLAPLFSLQEVALLAVTFTAGLRVMVALKLGRLELLTAGGPEIIEPLLAVYTGEDQVLGETARQVLLQLDNPATREKLCELAMQPNQPIVRQVVLQASYYPQEPHQRALFFFLTEQWDKYESLDFDHTLLKFRYDAADGQLRRRIGEMARLNGRAEIATMLVSGSGRGLTKQRLRSMSHEEWQLVVNLLLEGERWEEAWELVGSAPAIYSCQILKRLAEANWEPARSETALTFTDFAIKAAKCKAAYPPLGRQLKVYTKITLPSVQFNDIVISSDGRKLASIGVDNIIRLWSLPEGKLITEFQEELRQPDERGRMPDNTYQVRQLLFSPDGQTLAYDDGWHDNKWQGRWNVLNLTTRIARQVIKHGFAVEWQSKLAFSADGQLIAVDTTEGIRLAEVATGKLLGRLQGATFRNITSLVFSPDDKHLIAGIGQYNGTIAIWKLSDCSLIQNTSIAFGVMKKAFAFQPGSNNLIVAAHDAHIYLWDVLRKPISRILNGHHYQIGAIAVSHDGQRLATGHRDAIRLWDLPKRHAVKTVERLGHEMITDLVFSADDQFLLSATKSGKVTFWTSRLAGLARTNIEHIEPDDLQFTQRAQKDPALPTEERNWLQFVESLLGWQLRQLIESGETLSGQKWVASVETLLGWQLLHEVELDEAPAVVVNDFDIEIEG